MLKAPCTRTGTSCSYSIYIYNIQTIKLTWCSRNRLLLCDCRFSQYFRVTVSSFKTSSKMWKCLIRSVCGILIFICKAQVTKHFSPSSLPTHPLHSVISCYLSQLLFSLSHFSWLPFSSSSFLWAVICLLLHDTTTKLLYSLLTSLLLIVSAFLSIPLSSSLHRFLSSQLPVSSLLRCSRPWPPFSASALKPAPTFTFASFLITSCYHPLLPASLLIPHPPPHPPPPCLSLYILLFLSWSQAFAALISPQFRCSFLFTPHTLSPCYHDSERHKCLWSAGQIVWEEER